MSIIVSMVYVVYGYISKNASDYSLMTAENLELKSFSTRLKEDMFKADRISTTNSREFRMTFYDNSFVEYVHQQSHLIRMAGITRDSIKVSSISINYLDTIPGQGEMLIKNMLINADLYGSTAPIYIYKDYYSNYLNRSDGN